jgi:thioredoxin reductase (NADPH)
VVQSRHGRAGRPEPNHVHVLIRRDDITETISSYLAQRLAHHDRITVHPRSQLTSVKGEKRLSDSL